MKVGDRVRFSLKWRRTLCRNSRSKTYRDELIQYGNMCGTIILPGKSGTSSWLVQWDDGYDDTYHESNLTKVGVEQCE